jgi:cytochrome c553
VLFPPRSLVALFLLGLAAPPGARAAEPDAARSAALFKSDVAAILKANCVRCHGPKKTEGGLDLSTHDKLLAGGDSGAAVVPGNSKKSLLYQLAAHLKEPHMPDGGDKLPAAALARLAEWIDLGAAYDAPLVAAAPAKPHWAFQPVRRPAVPEAPETKSQITNPIDKFILATLCASGLSLSPEADRRTLIRRLKYDLLGLPPTPEEVEAFAKDESPDAYEKLVDAYLASPHHGERWARHWLDVVRFAESHGFEMNQPRPGAWHYRDWVIKALNADTPYDRFVRQQLAGDAVGADAATGFLVAGPWDQVKSPDVALTLQQRADELHDVVSTTGSAFLGLTVGCARCHAHKFDPIPQLDYYRLKAVFAGVQHGDRPIRDPDPLVLTDAERTRAEIAGLEARIAALEPAADPAATEPRRLPVTPRLNTERFAPVRAKFVRFVIFEASQLEPCIDELEVFTAGPKPANVALASAGAKARSAGDYPGSPNIHSLAFLIDGKFGNGRSWISNTVGRGRVEVEIKDAAEIDRITWSRDRDGAYKDRAPTRYRIDVSLDREAWTVVASSDDRLPFGSKPDTLPPGLTAGERAAWQKAAKQLADARERLTDLLRSMTAYAGKFTTPEPTFRLHRGDPTQNREPVGPGVLTEIGAKLAIPENATDRERRAALAEWVASKDNPLAARVIANRLWHYHFGTGIVDTPSDFGRNGGKPTHPELLDWLASELMEKKWSLKHVHRRIVTSATYRQSSVATREGLEKDAQSRLLWRYTPRRVEAEALRDSVLFVSGKLDLKMGGPGFDLFEPNTNYVKVYTPKQEFGPAEFRRMVYQHKPRMQLDDIFGAFDCPDGGQIAPKRNVSTTPLQSLNLLNSAFMLQQATDFAERVEKKARKDVPAQVRQVFRLAFQRAPTGKEQAGGEKLVRDHGLAALCRAVLNANEFAFVD